MFARSLAPLGVTTLLVACSARVGGGANDTDPTTSTPTSDESGSEATSSMGPDLPGTGDGDGEAGCLCADDEICVGDCFFADFDADSIGNRRCVGFEPCVGVDPYNAACVTEACGSPYASQNSCGPPSEYADIDLICALVYPMDCDELAPDCPEDEKCFFRIPPSELAYHSFCQVAAGTGGVGDACSSEGFASGSTDSCDATSLCWSGVSTAEPFEGACQPYCTGTPEDPLCPDGMTCELIDGLFHLCM